MKNKIPKESVFKKKGFYVALYSCLGIVMVMAAVVSFNNLVKSPEANSKKELAKVEEQINEEEAVATNQSTVKPLITQEDLDSIEKLTSEESIAKRNKKDKEEKQQETPVEETKEKDNKKEDSKKEEKKEEPKKENPTEEDSKEVISPEDVEDEEVNAEEFNAEPVFNEYTGNEKMLWPALGDIVMDFSNSHVIYDKTLDQYRTNDSLCIAADLGTQVVASAEGIVVSVENTKENGNTVVIDHGNGWTTTYSQLQDGVLVSNGDIVESGQVIGGVGKPSIYSVLLGNHLSFKVSKDSSLIDPKSILSEQ